MALFSMIFSCCASLGVKARPEYTGVDPRVQHIVDEYMWLSTQYNVHFNNKVTIGFKNIGKGNVVGLTTYGGYFREIDIDTSYWNNSTNTQRLAVTMHELGHAYCGRSHDYGDGKKYPEAEDERIAQAENWASKGGPRPGIYPDGCALSLMYPVVVPDYCIRSHYQEYTKELFDRCKAY